MVWVHLLDEQYSPRVIESPLLLFALYNKLHQRNNITLGLVTSKSLNKFWVWAICPYDSSNSHVAELKLKYFEVKMNLASKCECVTGHIATSSGLPWVGISRDGTSITHHFKKQAFIQTPWYGFQVRRRERKREREGGWWVVGDGWRTKIEICRPFPGHNVIYENYSSSFFFFCVGNAL